MNIKKIQTIEKIITHLESVNHEFSKIAEVIDIITSTKQEWEQKISNAPTIMQKHYDLLHVVWKIKSLGQVGDSEGYYSKLYNSIQKLNNTFVYDNDCIDIVNNDIIAEYRVVVFGEDEHSDQVEINYEAIKNYVEKIYYENLYQVAKKFDLFIKKGIDKVIEELELEHPEVNARYENVIKLEQEWNFYFNAYSGTIKNFALIYEAKNLKFIAKLNQYKNQIEDGKEFLLSKTCLSITKEMFQQPLKFVSHQKQMATIFNNEIKKFFYDTNLTSASNKTSSVTSKTEIFTSELEKFLDNQICLTKKNGEAFSELKSNFEKNILFDCVDESETIMAKQMERTITVTYQFARASNEVLLNKFLTIKENINKFELMIINSEESSYDRILYLELQNLFSRLRNWSNDLLTNDIVEFIKLKDQLSVNDDKDIMDNNLDVNILPDYLLDKHKVVKANVKSDHQTELELTNSEYQTIMEKKLNQILSLETQEWIKKNIIEKINILSTTLTMRLIQEQKDDIISDLEILSKNFVHVHDLLLNSELLIWVKNFLELDHNPLSETLLKEVSKKVVIQLNANDKSRSYLDNFQKNYLKRDQTPGKKFLIFLEHFDSFSFSDSFSAISILENLFNFFQEKVLNSPNFNISPESLFDTYWQKTNLWKNNEGIISVCSNAPTSLSEAKYFMEYKSKKTIDAIELWKKWYIKDITNYYGDNEDLIEKMQVILENIRTKKIYLQSNQDDYLPENIKLELEKELTYLEQANNQLKNNINLYLNDQHDQKIKNNSLYQDCFLEQINFRDNYHKKYLEILDETGIIAYGSNNFIDSKIGLFRTLISNAVTSEFNLKYGTTWAQQVNKVFNLLSLSIAYLYEKFEPLFKTENDQEQNYNLYDYNYFTATKHTQNFCNIPKLPKATMMTPDENSHYCCKDECNTYFKTTTEVNADSWDDLETDYYSDQMSNDEIKKDLAEIKALTKNQTWKMSNSRTNDIEINALNWIKAIAITFSVAVLFFCIWKRSKIKNRAGLKHKARQKTKKSLNNLNVKIDTERVEGSELGQKIDSDWEEEEGLIRALENHTKLKASNDDNLKPTISEIVTNQEVELQQETSNIIYQTKDGIEGIINQESKLINNCINRNSEKAHTIELQYVSSV